MNVPLRSKPLFQALKPADCEVQWQHRSRQDQRPAEGDQNCGEDAWTKMYPYIRELYIDKGNKLEKVMKLMESRHNFKASSMMYKKRLRRWGIFKNKRAGTARPAVGHTPAKSLQVSDGRSYQTGRAKQILAAPVAAPLTVSAHTGIMKALAGIREWSTVNREAYSRVANDPHCTGTVRDHLSPAMHVSGLLYRTFQCAEELLSRGEGLLAGKTVRKAFLQLEDVIEDDSPELMLRLLGIQFIMVVMGYRDLAYQMLNHLGRLTTQRLAQNHPLRKVISGLSEAKADLLMLIKQAWLVSNLDTSFLSSILPALYCDI
jgi:hypothetical protein